MKPTTPLARLLGLCALMALMAGCGRVSPHVTTEGDHASVTYGRPSKKGRDIFGALVPYDRIWRTGADEATLLSLDQEAYIGGETIPPGDYSLFTVPSEQEWTIILNKEIGQWGLDYDESKDVVRVACNAKQTEGLYEMLTMDFGYMPKGEVLTIAWDHTLVEMPIYYEKPPAPKPQPADSTAQQEAQPAASN